MTGRHCMSYAVDWPRDAAVAPTVPISWPCFTLWPCRTTWVARCRKALLSYRMLVERQGNEEYFA